MFTLTHNLILGSKSPRRQELLKGMGFTFVCRTKDTDENYPENISVVEVPSYLAKIKADALKESLSNNELLITSDTIVLVNNEVLGKPRNATEAIETLRKLSGKTHLVITGVALTTTSIQHTFSNTTEVSFKTMEESEIEYYVSTYRPFDKAGSYGIQEWIGYIGIEKMNGSYYSVMGLPTSKLWDELKNKGFLRINE